MPREVPFEIEVLRTKYDPHSDDAMGGGSPRFQLNLKDGNNVFVYVGTPPNSNDAADGDSGNLIESDDPRYDLSKIGGPQAATYDEARALIGTQRITGIQLVVDSSFVAGDGEQTIVVRPRVVVLDL